LAVSLAFPLPLDWTSRTDEDGISKKKQFHDDSPADGLAVSLAFPFPLGAAARSRLFSIAYGSDETYNHLGYVFRQGRDRLNKLLSIDH
jgi:hypothetical protein